MVTIDCRAMTVTVDGVTHRPARRQWLLITYLAANPEWVRSIEQVAAAIEAPNGSADTVRTAVKKARWIVGDAIECRVGLGYAWRAPVEVVG